MLLFHVKNTMYNGYNEPLLQGISLSKIPLYAIDLVSKQVIEIHHGHGMLKPTYIY